MSVARRAGGRRRGFTLLELLVAVAVGTVVLACVWVFFRATVVHSFATNDKVSAVQAALIFSAAMERDLRSLHEDGSHPFEVERGPEGLRIAFFRYVPAAAERRWLPVPVERVEYVFDGKEHRILRRAPGSRQVYSGLFERMGARLVEDRPGQAGSPPHAAAVVFSCVGAHERTLARAEGERLPKERTAIISAIPRYRAGSRCAYPRWNAIPYGPARRGR